MPVVLISHPECQQHFMGQGHPESPARLQAIDRELRASGLENQIVRHSAPEVDRQLLERVHDPDYVAAIFGMSPDGNDLVWLDPDTSMNAHSLPASLRAAGAGTLAVDLVMTGEADRAFCPVRPPGHHAERKRCMGFCIFNNIAVAATHALNRYGLQRLAIVDFDVHHGNGTEDIFRDDPRVLFCSTFQHPYYPFSGADTRSGHIVNTPLPAGRSSAAFRNAVSRQWLPALESHRPELILISAGFDAHEEDSMAGLELVDEDYAWVTRALRDFADSHCHGRMISLLEGGYALDALARSATVHVRELI